MLKFLTFLRDVTNPCDNRNILAKSSQKRIVESDEKDFPNFEEYVYLSEDKDCFYISVPDVCNDTEGNFDCFCFSVYRGFKKDLCPEITQIVVDFDSFELEEIQIDGDFCLSINNH